jgi:hypothetical protein
MNYVLRVDSQLLIVLERIKPLIRICYIRLTIISINDDFRGTNYIVIRGYNVFMKN